MRRLVPAMLFALNACVIDGVPLPDQRQDDNSGEDTPATNAPEPVSAYATRTAGVTVVFGLPQSVPPDAIVTVTSGTIKSSTVSADDGSFNVALGGDLSTTLTVDVIVGGAKVGLATLSTPVANQVPSPDNTAVIGAGPSSTVTESRTKSVGRVDATLIAVSFNAGAFEGGSTVAIINVDSGTTSTMTARADGGLEARAAAAQNDTLLFVTVTASLASSPYVIEAP